MRALPAWVADVLTDLSKSVIVGVCKKKQFICLAVGTLRTG